MDAGRVRWIGHSTVLISLDGVRLLTDPLLRRAGCSPPAARAHPPGCPGAGRRGADLHAHHDHLDFSSLRRVGRTTHIVAPRGLKSLLGRRGFNDGTEVDVGERHRIGAVEIEATFAAHAGGGRRSRQSPRARLRRCSAAAGSGSRATRTSSPRWLGSSPTSISRCSPSGLGADGSAGRASRPRAGRRRARPPATEGRRTDPLGDVRAPPPRHPGDPRLPVEPSPRVRAPRRSGPRTSICACSTRARPWPP